MASRTKRLSVPLTKEELLSIDEKAKAAGLTTAGFVRYILLNLKMKIVIE